MNNQNRYSGIMNQKWTKIILVFAIILFVGCKTSNNANKFYIANSTYDFGDTNGNELLKKTVTIKNLFDVPIQIINIKSSCKCVKTTASKASLKPNESMEIQIEFDTNGFSGVQKKSITIETDNENNKYIRFSVQTKITN